jgi:hypothetical protein
MSPTISKQTKVTLLLMMAIAFSIPRGARAATITVYSIVQKTNGVGPCSLQEAIYSANFDSNLAINGYSGSTPKVVTTQCAPGSGDDTIVLPAGARLFLNRIVDDADNPAGPTANPIINSRITILANGAVFQRIGTANFRLFTVGDAGYLTIQRAFIRGFHAKGGDGGTGGGGGMGAGGAIYVMRGVLAIEASTFEANSAAGGRTGTGRDRNGQPIDDPGTEGGGGGGIGGSGGTGIWGGGGGGGGARGNGGDAGVYGAGGGGTVSSGTGGEAIRAGRGGFECGGDGGYASDGQNARCAGGGGGGGGDDFTYAPVFFAQNGGDGHYGGGGGGGAYHGNGSGGRGGFGGGGGGATELAVVDAGEGGDGGFGGGGGSGGEAGFFYNGDGGRGGFFAGEGGDGGGGGGGAGLGGAIFNDSGAVDIRNSTFAGNAVSGGYSGGSEDGTGGGGAIFSRNGYLTILNSTISGNFANFGGGIIVAQDSESAPTSFVLQNTIVSGNGQHECAISGSTIAVAFAGNLIQSNAAYGTQYHHETFVGCQGVITTSDPQLGPLQYNLGATPTMAIAASSPAHDAADPGTSLAVDQRRSRRPSGSGFDIGAFELCDTPQSSIGIACGLLTRPIFDLPELTPLTFLSIQVDPPEGGTTTPVPGILEVDANAVVALNAIPNPGFRFATWSNNAANPAQAATTIVVQSSQSVTASFEACACARESTSAFGITPGGVTLNPITRRYVQTVTLRNNSGATITGPISLVLDNLTVGVALWNATGTTSLMLPAGSRYINTAANLAPGQSVSLQLQFTNPGNVVFSYDPRVLAGPGSR